MVTGEASGAGTRSLLYTNSLIKVQCASVCGPVQEEEEEEEEEFVQNSHLYWYTGCVAPTIGTNRQTIPQHCYGSG